MKSAITKSEAVVMKVSIIMKQSTLLYHLEKKSRALKVMRSEAENSLELQI